MPAETTAAATETNPEGGDPAVIAETSETTDNERVVNDNGFPDATPLAEMSVAEQAAYWKHKARQHEGRAKAKNTGGLSAEEAQALRDEIEQLRTAAMSDTERAQSEAITSATEQARVEARNELLPLLHEAQVRGYASTVISGERLDGWVDSVSVDKFLDAEGGVDGAKVVAHLTALFGEPEKSPAAPTSTYPNVGQASSGAGFTKAPAFQAGLAEAARRFGAKAEK
ncbi:hypothetical protein ACWZHB_00995 [Nocardia sp. FBN12]|uniref:hypothetical protein n=1 Tax=Nocardia sp. FBN12 TaxID=3419766 RepID=UPI003CFE8AF2